MDGLNLKALPTAKDKLTGVPVSRLTAGPGNYLISYYTALTLSPDGRYLACTGDGSGSIQAWLFDLHSGKGRAISKVPGGILLESIAFHPEKPWVFYGAGSGVWKYDLATQKTEVLFQPVPPFCVKSEISVGRNHLVFWIFDEFIVGTDARGQPPLAFHTLRNCRSYILAVNLDSGQVETVWGDTAPLTHPALNPLDDNIVLYANQGIRERLQELMVINRFERDNRKPLKLYDHYQSLDERPIYLGHSFFTSDGWIGCQLIEFGGRQPDGTYLDMAGFNAIVKPDGTCQRRARCPGGNRPVHTHAAHANSWWVGDTYGSEGANDPNLICVMKNNFETGYVQSEPLCAHGSDQQRPYHVHPQITLCEKYVLFNSNYTGSCHVYAAHAGDFLARWQDKVPFTPRPARYCMQDNIHPSCGPDIP